MEITNYLFGIIIFIILYLFIDYYWLQYKLGTLTGKYTYIKKPSGNLILVQHRIDNKTIYKIASEKDVKTLKKLNYIL